MSVVATRSDRWDTVLTVVLVVLLGVAALLALLATTLMTFDVDACASLPCNYPVISLGLCVASIGQLVVIVIAMAALWIRRSRGQRMFVAPLIGLAVSFAVLMGGLWLFTLGIPGSSIW